MKLGKKDGGRYETDYTSLTKGIHVFFPAEFRNDSSLVVGYASRWRKITTYDGETLISKKVIIDDRVRGHLLDSNNYLVILPANSEENVKIMDSLVKAEYKVMESAKNLIIDIRNNGGGTIRAYRSLIPFAYTNPIQQIGGNKLYSKLICDVEEKNLNEYEKENPSDTALIHLKNGWIQEYKMNMSKIEFDPGKLVRFDSIKRYPENVAIIANSGSMSAAEMMIYDYKQSKKVTVFGEHTYGGIDYLDNFYVDLPSMKYEASISSKERKILIGDKKRDYVGIFPDVVIPDSKTDWVKFVQDYYNKK